MDISQTSQTAPPMVYGPWAMNYIANDPVAFQTALQTRNGTDAATLSNSYFDNKTSALSSTTELDKVGMHLSTGGIATVPESITPSDHTKLTHKYANFTQIATTQQTSPKLAEHIQPVSSFVGSTLGLLTGMVQSPLGSGIPNIISDLIGKSDSKSVAYMSSSYQTLKTNEMTNQITNSHGSLAHLGGKSNAGNFFNDVYNGAISLIQMINKIKTLLYVGIHQLELLALDMIVPPNLIEPFMAIIETFFSKIPGISAIFNEIDKIVKYTNTFAGYLYQVNSLANNVSSLISTFTPSQLTSGQISINSISSSMSSLTPASITTSFSKILNTTSIGLGGNMSHGLAIGLQGMQSSVVSTILGKHSLQLGLLSPLFSSGQQQIKTYKLAYGNSGYSSSKVYNGEVYRNPSYIPSPLL